MKFIKPVCCTCGSDDVRADAYALWDPVSQEWGLSATFDKGGVCEKCGGETRLEDKALERGRARGRPRLPPGAGQRLVRRGRRYWEGIL
jgi:hypothetical protein